MSQFEYLRSISIGQYLPLDSLIHRLDPRAKLLAFSLVVVAVSLAPHLSGLLFGLLLAGFLLAASRVPLSYALRGWLSALPFLLLLAILQLFIAKPADTDLPVFVLTGIHIYRAGLQAAGRLLARFTVLMVVLTVATATLSTMETMHASHLLLQPLQWVGINPAPIEMMVQIMLRFLPLLVISAEKIAKSQASRGARWDGQRGGLLARARRVLPLIIPLFTNSLRQAETLADAMLARGFDARRKRTSMHTYRLQRLDMAFLCAMIAGALLIVFPIRAGF